MIAGDLGSFPQATAADDEVYIIGAFNGGEAAVGNSAYRLTRSAAIPAKWGVYVKTRLK